MGAILEHLTEERHVPEKQATKVIRTWDIKPIMDGDKEVGEMMLKNNEIHFALNKDARLKLGKTQLMKSVFAELFDEHEFLITKMFKGDRYIPLVQAFGFTKVSEDKTFDFFWMNKEDCKCLES